MIGPHKWPFPVKQIRGICPEEFLFYINYAFCVVNNSFHATVFSILFQKQFVTMAFQNRSVRMLELLKKVGLQDRYCDRDQNTITIMEKKIEYNKVEDKINKMKIKGIDYIDKQIYASVEH